MHKMCQALLQNKKSPETGFFNIFTQLRFHE